MEGSSENQRVKGVVGEVGLYRDGNQFNSFKLTIEMVLDSGKGLTYDQGEALMKQFRKELLGKNVELAAVVVPCPVCGKGFNSENGMKQHLRRIHGEKKTKRRSSRGRKK